MNKPTRPSKLGRLIHQARLAKGLTGYELAKRIGHVHRASIGRIESGEFRQPNTQTLRAIAQELDLEVADLFVLAGHALPTELPSFEPYLRAKHGHLPEAAIAKLTKQFETTNKNTKKGASQ